ncbi:MAG: LemA family protein [Methylohalobius crimeensis]|uniref:LemA family protein n=1 Tax=Methylohalobius crimeensis TaxID=244365 RepID=UPI0003B65734|nr:LemA family protein [Methylohalobius crimeensis]MBN2699837.1 LemA family protein [Methylothermaceae bacterium]
MVLIVLSVFAAIFIILIVYGIVIYNRLVSLKHAVSQSWSNIDVLLKQRHDELPKLVEVCKRYMKFEQDTLEKVMRARSSVFHAQQQGDVARLGQAENQLRQGLMNLFAVAESYPELKADQSFRHLESRITQLEEAIADRREFYNAAVNQNNVRIEQFPDIVIARWLNFQPFKLLEFSREEKQDVNLTPLFD